MLNNRMTDVISRNLIAPTLEIHEPSGQIVSYEDIIRMIDFYRVWLASVGVERGQRGIICLPNSANMQALFFACLELGVRFIGVEERRFYNFPRYSAAKVDFAITCSSWQEEMGTLPYPLHVMPDEVDLSDIELRTRIDAEIDPNEPAIMAITSGTTGAAKVIQHTHKTLLPSIRRAMEWYDSKDRVLFYMNLNHLGVLTIFTLPVLLKGCRIVLCHNNFVQPMIEALTTRSLGGIDKLLMFDWAWGRLLNSYDGSEPLLGPNKPIVITGGKPIGPSFISSLLEHGAGEIKVAYGMTEAPPPVIVKSVTSAEGYSRSFLGQPLSGWRTIVMENGSLLLKGDGVGLDARGRSLNDPLGWFVTPDSCWMEGNEIHIRSRRTVNKRNGQTVFLDDLTADMFFKPLDTKSMATVPFVVGPLEPKGEEDAKICLFTCRKQMMINGSPVSREAINAIIRETMIPEYQIDYLFLMNEIPDNGLKPDHTKLRQIALQTIAEQGEKEEYSV
jgi:acyl-CoA synthetase (AMP-forming)/AMP-acid ligase II